MRNIWLLLCASFVVAVVHYGALIATSTFTRIQHDESPLAAKTPATSSASALLTCTVVVPVWGHVSPSDEGAAGASLNQLRSVADEVVVVPAEGHSHRLLAQLALAVQFPDAWVVPLGTYVQSSSVLKHTAAPFATYTTKYGMDIVAMRVTPSVASRIRNQLDRVQDVLSVWNWLQTQEWVHLQDDHWNVVPFSSCSQQPGQMHVAPFSYVSVDLTGMCERKNSSFGTLLAYPYVPNHKDYFNIWTTPSNTFQPWRRRFLRTILHTAPNSHVTLFSNSLALDALEPLQTSFPGRASIQRFDTAQLFRGTPLQELIPSIERCNSHPHAEDVTMGPYFYSHITDAFRLLFLWLYGGVYVDSDIALLRDLQELPPTLIGYQQPNRLNGAVLKFPAQHPFLMACMEEYVRRLKLPCLPESKTPTCYKDDWILVGPALLTDMVLSFPGLHANEGDSRARHARYITLLDAERLYPIPWYEANGGKLILSDNTRIPAIDRGDAFTFHLWNKLMPVDVIFDKSTVDALLVQHGGRRESSFAMPLYRTILLDPQTKTWMENSWSPYSSAELLRKTTTQLLRSVISTQPAFTVLMSSNGHEVVADADVIPAALQMLIDDPFVDVILPRTTNLPPRALRWRDRSEAQPCTLEDGSDVTHGLCITEHGGPVYRASSAVMVMRTSVLQEALTQLLISGCNGSGEWREMLFCTWNVLGARVVYVPALSVRMSTPNNVYMRQLESMYLPCDTPVRKPRVILQPPEPAHVPVEVQTLVETCFTEQCLWKSRAVWVLLLQNQTENYNGRTELADMLRGDTATCSFIVLPHEQERSTRLLVRRSTLTALDVSEWGSRHWGVHEKYRACAGCIGTVWNDAYVDGLCRETYGSVRIERKE